MWLEGTNKHLLGVREPPPPDDYGEETPHIVGEPILLGEVIIQFTTKELLAVLLTALCVLSIYFYFEIHWGFGLGCILYTAVVIFVGIRQYAKTSYLSIIAMSLLALPTIGAVVFYSIEKDVLNLAVYLIAILVGVATIFVVDRRYKIAEEEGEIFEEGEYIETDFFTSEEVDLIEDEVRKKVRKKVIEQEIDHRVEELIPDEEGNPQWKINMKE